MLTEPRKFYRNQSHVKNKTIESKEGSSGCFLHLKRLMQKDIRSNKKALINNNTGNTSLTDGKNKTYIKPEVTAAIHSCRFINISGNIPETSSQQQNR